MNDPPGVESEMTSMSSRVGMIQTHIPALIAEIRDICKR